MERRTLERRAEIGDWRLENVEDADSGVVLWGDGQAALLKTAFPGTDYVFTAKGRAVNGAWGVAARAQNDGSLVRAVLREGRLDIDRVAEKNITSLASTPLPDVEMKAWHELSVKLIGERIEVFIDGKSVVSAIDPQPLPQGNSAIFADGSVQVDAVMWRKAAAQEPSVTVGKRELPADAKNGWLAFAPSPTPAPAPQPVPTQLPIDHSTQDAGSPLMVIVAAASLVIAGGILLLGLLRNR